MKLSLTTTPSGGWQFYQPETGWNLPSPLNHSFESAVNTIVKHRMANPVLASQASFGAAADDLQEFTIARLGLNKSATPPATVTQQHVKRCGFCGRK